MGWINCDGYLWRDQHCGYWFICCHDRALVRREADGPAVRDLARFGWSVTHPVHEHPYCSHRQLHRFVEESPGIFRTQHWVEDPSLNLNSPNK
jgi:hypothetical protein